MNSQINFSKKSKIVLNSFLTKNKECVGALPRTKGAEKSFSPQRKKRVILCATVSLWEEKDNLYIHERHELRIKLSTILFRKESYEIIIACMETHNEQFVL